jgi:CDP-paratose 2-epimerase
LTLPVFVSHFVLSMKKLLVTGSSGLIGSETVDYFYRRGWSVSGIDNNMRADFFGPQGDTSWNLSRLQKSCPNFSHSSLDIRNRPAVADAIKSLKPDLIVHAAAQPSHDLAAKRPFDDFDVNAVGTLNLLEATRQHAADAVFIMMSTNKVYGDAPNELPIKELATRWDYARPQDFNGIPESFRIDQSLHSLFGASKVAADVLAQEYGRYFQIKTTIFRGGCLTGPNHSGVPLHGFLNYLFKVVRHGQPYTVIGYKGKQVRDNIHSLDVSRAIEAVWQNPRCGEVYNLGGGRDNSCSVLEALSAAESLFGKKAAWTYKDENRKGDHICYISDLTKLKSHYPTWSLSKSLQDIYSDLAHSTPPVQ